MCLAIIAPLRRLSRRILGLHPQFPLGRITPRRRHRVIPLLSPYIESDSGSSSPPLDSKPGSPLPHSPTMSSANAGTSPNAGGKPGPNSGATSSGTNTGTMLATPLLPFMAGLSLSDFSKLINDPIQHDLGWPVMPTKFPSNIPKFEGNDGEDPTNHICSFHMWCSSNSITDDSIHLQLFQHMLTGDTAKWYVDHASASHSTFATLAKVFQSYFQLPLRYDTGTELLTTFRQNSATRLSNHVQEWHKRRSLCQAPTFNDCVYMDWFLRMLFPSIGKDVASHFPHKEEETFQIALKYDLIYAQSGYVYTILPDLPRLGGANASGASHADDGIVGSLSHPYTHPTMGYGFP